MNVWDKNEKLLRSDHKVRNEVALFEGEIGRRLGSWVSVNEAWFILPALRWDTAFYCLPRSENQKKNRSSETVGKASFFCQPGRGQQDVVTKGVFKCPGTIFVFVKFF